MSKLPNNNEIRVIKIIKIMVISLYWENYSALSLCVSESIFESFTFIESCNDANSFSYSETKHLSLLMIC